MGAPPIGQAMAFMLVLVASIVVGVCVLAYAARCVPPLSFSRVVDAL